MQAVCVYLLMAIFSERLQNCLFCRNIRSVGLEVNFSNWQKKLLQLYCILVHNQVLSPFMKKNGCEKSLQSYIIAKDRF